MVEKDLDVLLERLTEYQPPEYQWQENPLTESGTDRPERTATPPGTD